MQHHEGQGNPQPYGSGRAVQHAGVAVPALFAINDPGRSPGGILFKHVHGADIGACSAACAQFLVYDRRHVLLLQVPQGTHMLRVKFTEGKASFVP